MGKLRHAMVCGSNMNRSMEAHKVLSAHGLEVRCLAENMCIAHSPPWVHQVESYGVGGHVKLPGPSADQPNVYEFGTPYEAIKADLEGKNPELYTRNGLLKMLARNINTKRAPERWQDTKYAHWHAPQRRLSHVAAQGGV